MRALVLTQAVLPAQVAELPLTAAQILQVVAQAQAMVLILAAA